MKTRKISLQFLVFSFFMSFMPLILFSQEEPLRAFKWYYCPRAYPFDTIPGGAFKNAVDQREALLQSTGYQFPGSGWQEIGPKPFDFDYYHYIGSGRIHHVIYDPQDPNEDGSGRVIYVTGACGGLWKTIDGGVNWENKSGDLPSLSAGAFVIDSARNILYFGSGGGSPFYFINLSPIHTNI